MKSTNVGQIAFCNLFLRDRRVMVLYVCVGTGLYGEEKFCVGL